MRTRGFAASPLFALLVALLLISQGYEVEGARKGHHPKGIGMHKKGKGKRPPMPRKSPSPPKKKPAPPKASPSPKPVASSRASIADIIVPDDYKTIQAAVDASKDNASPGQGSVIYIRAGKYDGQVWVMKSKKYLTLIGDGQGKTILTAAYYAGMSANDIGGAMDQRIADYLAATNEQDMWDGFDNSTLAGAMGFGDGVVGDFGSNNIGTSGAGSIHILAVGFLAVDMTFENRIDPRKCGCNFAMAPAVHVHPGKSATIGTAFYRCSFLGNQDTVYLHSGPVYISNSFIKGYIDFIFGPSVALIEDTTLYINTKIDTAVVGVTAQSRQDSNQWSGFSFNRGKLTGDGGKLVLGRMWGPAAAVIFSNYYMDDVVEPVGWFDWGNNGKNAFYAEYNNKGPGSDTSKRVSWSKQLSSSQAQPYLSKKYIKADSWLRPPPI